MPSHVFNEKHFLLDIETSGLNKNTDYVVCIGITFIDKESEIPSQHQWMLQFPQEEKQLLSDFLRFIEDFSHVYTYSGKYFDWPFLLARCTFHHLDVSILQRIHLIDMKKSLQPFGTTRTDLENTFGIVRHLTTSGKELARVYKTYQSCGDMIYKKLILNHNKEELFTLLHFYELYQTLYHLKHHRFIDMTHTSSCMVFSFEVPFIFNTNFEGGLKSIRICWKAGTQLLTIKLNFLRLELKQYLTPYKDYYYIPSQNQLLHRTLAGFISSSDKRKASKEECTIYKEDHYIPLCTTYKLGSSVWYDSDHTPYLGINDFSASILVDQLFYLFFSSKKTS